MATRRRDRGSEDESAKSNSGGRTGADVEADPAAAPGGTQRMRPLTVNVGTVSVFLRSSLDDPLTELVPFVKIENQFLDFNIKNLDYLIFEKEILI
ncbi:hypothetical protein T03_14489 [Trichinella britovi]|uniref:Uncharacterized protein n=1 Tax=Trichinella britovi TaxID=45882 RepID=A0A0V1DFF7_TRIBR|nr:hypothetical protein T03_14489 [Trichinella britovi]